MFIAAALLAVAIATEVVATAVLPRAEGFTDPGWSAVVVAGYAVSIWLLTLVVREIPVSVTYAIWAGAGTAAIAVVGVIFLDEPVTVLKIVAISLIIAGVVLINLQGSHA
ncbi:DMT family transporter [Aeromicrobium fastidiosum]|uniref:Multidrug efflux SMR transporter n=1 Tax=Aeromicrobium fastidiosum TaxID=52699 RepID=A0A641ALL6_9ACTN|nr:multidrug efflux SMR transporter [Aeromicrobium fastidiosum]KAA1374876.1 multidrug efflux SMR transporter [Aeromicrobium fastidiosum]MBP2390558.1 small multidrug resistance pump [Aeromicrobium fastidiosum]